MKRNRLYIKKKEKKEKGIGPLKKLILKSNAWTS